MAEPSKKTGAAHSSVASCAATDCSHNENRQCHAGEIQVRFEGGKATCGTYSPEKPKARP